MRQAPGTFSFIAADGGEGAPAGEALCPLELPLPFQQHDDDGLFHKRHESGDLHDFARGFGARAAICVDLAVCGRAKRGLRVGARLAVGAKGRNESAVWAVSGVYYACRVSGGSGFGRVHSGLLETLGPDT